MLEALTPKPSNKPMKYAILKNLFLIFFAGDCKKEGISVLCLTFFWRQKIHCVPMLVLIYH
jgi:hypothetical protein